MSEEIKISMRVPGTSPMPELLALIKRSRRPGSTARASWIAR